MKGRRYPFRLRADGQKKYLHLERAILASVGPWIVVEVLDHSLPPSACSAERTRCGRALAGARRTKRMAGAR